MKKIVYLISTFIITAVCLASSQAVFADEFLIADFESWPNNVGGEMGVYGSLSPDWSKKATVPYSWIYEKKTPGYSTANVKEGRQSFRLVHGLGSDSDCSWGSFGMNLGKVTDLTVEPVNVQPIDTERYIYLTFWVKGEKGGENAELSFRDARSISYMPQATYEIPEITNQWQKVVVPLSEIEDMVDLSELVHVGIAFGGDVGNEPGAIIYVDDFRLSDSK